jgi:uncharacterized protein YkuJ
MKKVYIIIGADYPHDEEEPAEVEFGQHNAVDLMVEADDEEMAKELFAWDAVWDYSNQILSENEELDLADVKARMDDYLENYDVKVIEVYIPQKQGVFSLDKMSDEERAAWDEVHME